MPRSSSSLTSFWLRIAILAVVATASLCRSTAQGFNPDAAAGFQRKTLGQEIGSPSELAWQAWLLVENKAGGQSALDSSNILRRITPKSIFIAPELVSCPPGYSSDGKGVCKPDPIKIDEDAQRQFFLKRLNALYGKLGGGRKKPDLVAGPLQINIPISLQAKPQAVPTTSQRPLDAVYQVANHTKKNDEAPFFLDAGPKKPEKLEIADVSNDTLVGVVDYKIPALNRTADSDSTPSEKKADPAEDSSPTMVLLVSSSKLPLTTISAETPKPMISQKWMGDRVSKLSDPTTEPPASVELKFERDAAIQTVAPLATQTDSAETTFATTTTETEEPVYVDDEYDDATTEESEDELLKAGEAGAMVSSTLGHTQDHTRTEHHKLSTLPDNEGATFAETTAAPTLPTLGTQDSTESTYLYAKEDAMTTQTTEVPSTIVTTTEPPVEETTFFSTRPQRIHSFLKATTRIMPTTQAPVTTSTEIFKTEPQEFSKTDIVTEPEVIYSTQNSNGFTTFYNQRKSPTHPSRIVETPAYNFDVLEDIPRTEPPPSFPEFLRPKPSLRVNDRPVLFKHQDDIPSEFRDQFSESSRPFSSDFRRIVPNDDASTYVRFPDQSAPQDGRSRDYIRFPSDEVNSIHNQDAYKDLPYRPRDEFHSAASTRSSAPARQKPPSTYWRLPAQARTDRQQPANSPRQRNQKPMLLKFWARMPLVRDLSFYPTTSHGSHNEPIGGQADARRPRLSGGFVETATHDVNRLLAQRLGQPGIGAAG